MALGSVALSMGTPRSGSAVPVSSAHRDQHRDPEQSDGRCRMHELTDRRRGARRGRSELDHRGRWTTRHCRPTPLLRLSRHDRRMFASLPAPSHPAAAGCAHLVRAQANTAPPWAERRRCSRRLRSATGRHLKIQAGSPIYARLGDRRLPLMNSRSPAP
jgi:hypothetical protein